FIEKQQVGIPGQRARHGQPLFLSAGQLSHPAAALPFELRDLQQLVDRTAAQVERSKQPQHLFNGELVGQLRVLQLNSQALPELRLVGLPPESEHFDIAGVRRQQSLEDLDGRGLPGTIGPEQSKTFASTHVERQAVNGHNIAITPGEPLTSNGKSIHVARFCNNFELRIYLLSTLYFELFTWVRLSFRVAATILIASPEHLTVLRERADFGDAQAFADTEALKALETITRQRPSVVALERVFATTSRGAALINRIKADPALASCEIRIVAHDSDYARVSPRRAESSPGAAPQTQVSAPPVAVAEEP